MSRDLRAIDSSDHQSLTSALATALDGVGPAVFPRSSLTYSELPTSVDSRVALVIETSGSTTRPKRVWHTAESLQAAADQVNDELDGSGLWWNALPCHYIAGVMVVVRALRSTSEVIAKNPRHSIGDSLLAFDQKANESSPSVPRFTSLVPKQLSDLISAAAGDHNTAEALRRFSQILVGGQRVPNLLITKAEELGLRVTKTYGSAETAGGCVWDGKPLSQSEVAVIDNRIALSGPMLAGGYLGDPEKTDRSFVMQGSNHWFITEDYGEIKDGRVQVHGRADRVIVSGGEKISLDEVEEALGAEFPSMDLATVSVVDATWGEAIVVISNSELERPAVQGFLRERFGRATQVAWTKTVPELPYLSSGKINRAELERLVTSATDVDSS